MTRLMQNLHALSGRFRRAEDGQSTVEFVMAVPLLLTIFMASFESGILMVRSIILEQSLDLTIRELRLGSYPTPTSALLKKEICDRSSILVECEKNITVEMTRISTQTWSMPSSRITCVDREEELQPTLDFQIGDQNDVMLLRVCVVQETMFPTTGLGLDLPTDAEGGFGLTAVTAFSIEPN
jgi:hypothetical protein